MSLFNETWQRAIKAENELDCVRAECVNLRRQLKAAEGRCKNLEIALKAARNDRAQAFAGRYPLYGNGSKSTHYRPFEAASPRAHLEGNELSGGDVEELFKAKKYYDDQDAKVAKSVDAADLKSAAGNGMSVRSRLLAPIARLLGR